MADSLATTAGWLLAAGIVGGLIFLLVIPMSLASDLWRDWQHGKLDYRDLVSCGLIVVLVAIGWAAGLFLLVGLGKAAGLLE